MAAVEFGGNEKIRNQGVLKNFADKTGGLFLDTPGGVAMREAFKRIVQELGVQYTLGYQPANAKKDGKWRAIELKVARPNLSIRTRKGYNSAKN
jgi:Ca-activated chloride channel family protein